LTWLALEYGDKKPVGAVPCRGQPKIGHAARRSAADRLGPYPRDRQQREIGLGREKGACLRLVLLVQHRAGRIDEPPARANQACRAAEYLLLPEYEVSELLRGNAPFVAWVAAPGPGAEARRIDQHPVEMPRVVLDPSITLAGQRAP